MLRLPQIRSIVKIYKASVVSKALLAVVGVLLIRWMEIEQLALFTFGVSVSTLILQPLTSLANRVYIVYPELGDANKRVFLIGTSQLLIISTIAGIFMAAAPMPADLVAVIFLVVAGITATEFAKTIYQSAQDFRAYRCIEYVRAIGMLAGVLLLGAAEDTLRATDVLLVQALVGFAIGLPVTLSRSRMEWSWLQEQLRASSLRSALLHYDLVAYVILQSLISQADTFVLKAVSSGEQLATYGAALRYYGFIILALASVQTVLLPMAREALVNSEVRLLLQRYRWLILAFVPATLFCAITANWFIPWIDHGRYPMAVPTFQILSLSAVISFSFGVYAILAVNMHLFRLLFRISVVTGIFCLGSNWWLASRWGAVGAATATLLTHAGFNISVFLLLRRDSRKRSELSIPAVELSQRS
jgi:O-antigen/teichoic acid export membrane protein